MAPGRCRDDPLSASCLGRSARRRHREAFWAEWSEDQLWRRALRPGCRPMCDQPSTDGSVAQLGTLRFGFPERPSEFDPDPLAVGELELDGVPAWHEVAVPVGLRDPDSVPGTGTPWTAVVPPECPHRVTLPVGPARCCDVVEEHQGNPRAGGVSHRGGGRGHARIVGGDRQVVCPAQGPTPPIRSIEYRTMYPV
jgi:hypothetical protein